MIPSVIAYGTLSGPLPKVGLIVVALLAAAVLLLPARRPRAAATVGALGLAPVLLVASIWHDSRLRVLRDHPLAAVVALLVGLAVLIAVGAWLRRRSQLFAPLAVLALPFRVPITLSGTTSNLLVPLYAVVALGAVASVLDALPRERSPFRSRREAAAALGETSRGKEVNGAASVREPALLRWLAWLLSISLVLYAVQATYSTDFQTALQNTVFFYVPFAVLYRLLREVDWTQQLLRRSLGIVVGLGIVFSLVGFVEYATKTILLNPKLVTTNDLHAYFTVNSLFFDPDIFGRYLALAMLLLAAGLLYRRAGRALWATIAALTVMWACLCLTLSRSSLAALLIGMAVLTALRWKPSRALVVAVAVIIVGAITVVATPRTFGLNEGLNGVSSGRGGLVSGGISLFSERPGWGYGAGSFVTEYRAHHHNIDTTLSASHTILVTVAAEQGVIGLIVYVALLVCGFTVVLRRARGDPVRSAIAAAFIALVFHTLLYADFLEDPTTWALLAVGASLATVPRARSGRTSVAARSAPERGIAPTRSVA